MFPTIPIEAARVALAKRRADESWTGAPFVRWVEAGARFEEDRAEGLLEKLMEVRDGFQVDPLPTTRGKDFESPASAIVHSELGIDARIAGSREFWLWLTFVAVDGRFADLVDWRFGARQSIDDVNYGITRRSGVWEGLFARLWLRGNIGFDPDAPDPYRLARKGDIDIWRSHIIRVEYGRCKPVAHALLDYQYPDRQAEVRLKRDELRELAKRLRIVDASVSYELLDDGSIKDLIEENGERVKSSGT